MSNVRCRVRLHGSREVDIQQFTRIGVQFSVISDYYEEMYKTPYPSRFILLTEAQYERYRKEKNRGNLNKHFQISTKVDDTTTFNLDNKQELEDDPIEFQEIEEQRLEEEERLTF